MAQASHQITLKVQSADDRDIYKDIARIARADRGDLKAGRVYHFSHADGAGYFIVRGLHPRSRGSILLDEDARSRLDVQIGEEVSFTIRRAGFLGELAWAWQATDPAYRVASQLGVLGLVLGVLGALMGGLSLWLAINPPK